MQNAEQAIADVGADLQASKRRRWRIFLLSLLLATMVAALWTLVSVSTERASYSLYPSKDISRPTAGLRVLFVGNSHTYVHDLPQIVRFMSEASLEAPDIDARMVAPSGVTLEDHWNVGETQKVIEGQPWDFVVLQEQSGRSVYHVADMHEAIRKFVPFIRAHRGKPLLYLGWRRLDLGPEWSQDAWTESGVTISRELSIPLAPVGVAFMKALEGRETGLLYEPDGNHATAAGAYLAACVLFSSLTGLSPLGLPAQIPTLDASSGTWGTSLEVDLTPDLARALQEAASASVAEVDSLMTGPLEVVSHEHWFGMAMVYAQEGKLEAAIDALTRYLTRPGLYKVEAEAGLKEMQAALEEKKGGSGSQKPAP